MIVQQVVDPAKVHEIWSDIYKQLGELASQTGCEAGARRAFHDGRFATLKELGLLGQDNAPRVRSTLTTMTEPESTEATEASADEAEATSDDDATEADEVNAE